MAFLWQRWSIELTHKAILRSMSQLCTFTPFFFCSRASHWMKSGTDSTKVSTFCQPIVSFSPVAANYSFLESEFFLPSIAYEGRRLSKHHLRYFCLASHILAKRFSIPDYTLKIPPSSAIRIGMYHICTRNSKLESTKVLGHKTGNESTNIPTETDIQKNHFPKLLLIDRSGHSAQAFPRIFAVRFLRKKCGH